MDALLHTLTVEAAVHDLDLEPVLPERPADIPLGAAAGRFPLFG